MIWGLSCMKSSWCQIIMCTDSKTNDVLWGCSLLLQPRVCYNVIQWKYPLKKISSSRVFGSVKTFPLYKNLLEVKYLFWKLFKLVRKIEQQGQWEKLTLFEIQVFHFSPFVIFILLICCFDSVQMIMFSWSVVNNSSFTLNLFRLWWKHFWHRRNRCSVQAAEMRSWLNDSIVWSH